MHLHGSDVVLRLVERHFERLQVVDLLLRVGQLILVDAHALLQLFDVFILLVLLRLEVQARLD